MKTLVIILGETRAHELTFENIKQNLIDVLQADVAVCIGISDSYDYTNPFYKIAKYRFTHNEPDDYGSSFDTAESLLLKNNTKKYEELKNVNTLHGKIIGPGQSSDNIKYIGNFNDISEFDLENSEFEEIIYHDSMFPDEKWRNHLYGVIRSDNNNYTEQHHVHTYKKPIHWRKFLSITWQIMGGVKDPQHQQPGSAGILLFYRWLLHKNLIEHDLVDKYDRFIITRSDYMYLSPHPKMEILDPDNIWIPFGEGYGGYTDRHTVLTKDTVLEYLDIFNCFVLRSNEYYLKLLSLRDYWYNLEKLIKFHLELKGLTNRVKYFPYIMYSVRNINGSTRWEQGKYSDELGYFIKYPAEHKSSIHYSKLIQEKIDEVYKNECKLLNG